MSPINPSQRQWLAAYADRLLLSVRPFASADHAHITLPGTPGGFGTAVDGLEGFARTFLIAAFTVTGAGGADPAAHLAFYARGLAAGSDPGHPERWVRPTEHAQAKVEAASLALGLDLTRSWLWDGLDTRTQGNIVDYLAEVVGDQRYPANNWLWFRIVVETFLRSVDGPHRVDDIVADLHRHDSYYQAAGWYRDGESRSYDHYVGWAMHLYPTMWSRMSGAPDLAAKRADTDRVRLDRYLIDAVRLVGADGAPLMQGRSLTYRFAAAAPFWAGVLAEVPSTAHELLRDTAVSIVRYFADHGVPNARGLLDIGWWGPWRPLAQSYSGPGSPYWASKGLLGLLIPAEDPVWGRSPAPLASRQDFGTTIAAPGWAVIGTGADGVVRVANHGTDHADVGDDGGDSPLYTRLGYSTATFPLHRGRDWIAPVDQSVVLVDAAGRRSHRTGMTTLAVRAAGALAAASRAQAHWIDPMADGQRLGTGVTGRVSVAGELIIVSVLNGAWEVRLIHVLPLNADARVLECGGWPLADDAGVAASAADGPLHVVTRTPQLQAHLIGLHGWGQARAEHRDDASPLGAHAVVGVLSGSVTPGWTACALALAGAGVDVGQPPTLALDSDRARIGWPDGSITTMDLPQTAGPGLGDQCGDI
ncbi:MAG: DUF2264 domain-containing protein [Beutenbergiaceae bacterium]